MLQLTPSDRRKSRLAAFQGGCATTGNILPPANRVCVCVYKVETIWLPRKLHHDIIHESHKPHEAHELRATRKSLADDGIAEGDREREGEGETLRE